MEKLMLLYTKVETYGNKIYFSGLKNGKKVNVESKFKPCYFIESQNKNSEYKSIYGAPLLKRECEIRDFYNIESNKNYHGTIRPQYQFINEYFPDLEDFDSKLIDVWFWDIEIDVNDKFPSPEFADAPINLITLKRKSSNKFIILSTKDYNLDLSKAELENYSYDKRIFNSEKEMLISFCNFLRSIRPHVLVGWNSIFFDWVYITNRIKNIIGEEYLKSASPFGFFKNIQVQNISKDYPEPVLDLGGITNLDLMSIFRKYTFKEYESYSLDYISSEILNLRKLKQPDMSFKEFMNDHWDDFVLYNLYDVYLVEQIENKTNLLELVFTLAYVSGVNYIDVFSETRVWDSIIYRHLYKNKIIIPPKKSNKSKDFPGGVVKDTISGIHDWISVFDFKSLYPSIMRSLNLSFETINQSESIWEIDIEDIEKNQPIHKDYCTSAAGYLFRKDITGTFPILMEKFFNKRLEYQKLKKQNSGTPKELIYDSFQLTFKILINSLFGAIGTPYFRFYDYRIACSITMTGQLAAKWVIKYTNKKLNEYFGTYDKDYVIANDTDSVMYTLGLLGSSDNKEQDFYKVLEFSKEKLQKWIEEAIDILCNSLNTKERVLFMEREPLAVKGFFQTKKRYILKIVEKDEKYSETPYYKIRGLNSVRSSTPEFFRKKLNEFYEYLLSDDFNLSLIEDFVEKSYEELKQYDLSKIANSCKVNNIEKYLDNEGNILKGCPYNVRAAINYNRLIKEYNLEDSYPIIQSGDKAKILYIKEGNPYNISVISFKTQPPLEILDLKVWTDYSKMFTKELISPLEKVCEVINYNGGKIKFSDVLNPPKPKRKRKGVS
ncbi:MAG: DNA polymerase domain-containing protein [Thermoplasmata archaeon]